MENGENCHSSLQKNGPNLFVFSMVVKEQLAHSVIENLGSGFRSVPAMRSFLRCMLLSTPLPLRRSPAWMPVNRAPHHNICIPCNLSLAAFASSLAVA